MFDVLPRVIEWILLVTNDKTEFKILDEQKKVTRKLVKLNGGKM